MFQTDPPRSPKDYLPTMYDLPSENPEEPGLPDEFHLLQPRLLEETFLPPDYLIENVFVGSDLNLYYDVRHTGWYKHPDWFGVVGISRLYEQRDLRLSYVTWQEGVDPMVVVELLSPGTEREDLGQTLRDVDQPPTKWEVYERILRIPYYMVFNRYTDELQVFRLEGGSYGKIEATPPRFWFEELRLGLGLWEGTYQGIERQWLRWFDALGNWVPTPLERQTDLVEQERQRTEEERQRSERLIAQLRSLGIEPDL